MNNKGQIAIEYMLIIGFAITLLIPLFFIYSSQSADFICKVDREPPFIAGQRIADTAETVFYLGYPSRADVRVRLPISMKSGTLANRETVFAVCNSTITEVIIPTSINMTGTLPSNGGTYLLQIENKGTYVEIS